MVRNWFKWSLVPVLACFAGSAMAQDSLEATTTASPARPVAGQSRFAAELKPLPVIVSLVPGVSGAGVGGEWMATRDTAIYTEVNYLDSNLSGRTSDQARSRAGESLYPNKVRAVNFDVGGRFYTTPLASSWYGGAKLGYSTVRGEWFYHDETVDQKTAALTPGVNAGYRWKWENDVLVRLGAGAAANVVQFQETKRTNDTEDSKEAQDKLDKNARVPFLANIDLGVGYMF